nr:AzlC family ABC transporter permease [Shuttleworthia sp. MSX8B]
MNRENFRMGMRDGIPIALGYFAVSFAFGMTAVADGMRGMDAVIISATNVTSAGQFAGLGIILGDGSYLEILLSQLVINLRYMLMSFSLAQRMEPDAPLYKRLLMSFGVTDEIFGISITRPGYVRPDFHLGAMAVAIPGWVLGTATGAVMGKLLPAMILSALSVAIYGMFLAIIIPPMEKDHSLLGLVLAAMSLSAALAYGPELLEGALGLVSGLLPRLSSGTSVIIVTVFAAALFAWIRPLPQEEADADAAEEGREKVPADSTGNGGEKGRKK